MMEFLVKGQIVLVSEEDSYLSGLKWYISDGYACDCKGRPLHRYIEADLFPEKGDKYIDHKNRNKLDNRRENFRLVTIRENILNRDLQKNNTSGYKGVSFHRASNKWCAKIGKRWLGLYNTPEGAALVFNYYALEEYKDFAILNDVVDPFGELPKRILHGKYTFFTHEGQTLTLYQWIKKLGFSPSTVYRRIQEQGKTIEEALELNLES